MSVLDRNLIGKYFEALRYGCRTIKEVQDYTDNLNDADFGTNDLLPLPKLYKSVSRTEKTVFDKFLFKKDCGCALRVMGWAVGSNSFTEVIVNKGEDFVTMDDGSVVTVDEILNKAEYDYLFFVQSDSDMLNCLVNEDDFNLGTIHIKPSPMENRRADNGDSKSC